MNFIQNLVDPSKYNVKCPYSMNPVGIVVHNTYNDASAKNEVAYMIGNDKQVSFHYAVDDIECVQGVLDNRNTWNAGDGSGLGNRGHISYEICYSKSGGEKFTLAEKNCAKAIAMKLKEKNWGLEKVKKHQDFSGKYCPHRTLDMGWQRFLDMIRAEMNGGQASVTPPSPPVQDSIFERAKKYNTPRCRELQDKLNRAGYPCGSVDGIYGNKTHSALGKFQGDSYLSVDYLAGKNTFSKLDEKLNAPKPTGDDWVRRLQAELNKQGFKDMNGNSLRVDGYKGDKTLSACPTLKKGAKGNITRLAQEKIVALGYNPNGIDGKFGNGMVEAVKDFQSDKKLSSDGVIGKATWSKLM